MPLHENAIHTPVRGRWPGTIRAAGDRGSTALSWEAGAGEVESPFSAAHRHPRGAREGRYPVVL